MDSGTSVVGRIGRISPHHHARYVGNLTAPCYPVFCLVVLTTQHGAYAHTMYVGNEQDGAPVI